MRHFSIYLLSISILFSLHPLLVAEWILLNFFFLLLASGLACLSIQSVDFMLDCENAGLSTYTSAFYLWFAWTHSNYCLAYFKSQEAERGLFVQRQRTLKACFSLRKTEMKSSFEDASVVFKSLPRQLRHTVCTIYSLTLYRGKTQGGWVCVCVCMCVFMSVSVHVYWRDRPSRN